MGSYVVGVYVVGAALEYCLKDWELVMPPSIGMHLPQAYISYRHASLTCMHHLQASISHRHTSLTGLSLAGMHLLQACLFRKHTSHRCISAGVYLSHCCGRGLIVN